MEQERRNDGRQLFDAMLNFARLGTSDGVNNFVLAGPVDVPTIFHTLVGTFPDLSGSDSSIVVAGTRGSNVIDVYSQVLSLEVPKRIENLRIKDNEEARRVLEVVCARGSLPSILIGIGETRDTEEKVVVLCSVMGISPQKALLDIQDRVKSRMAKFN